MRAKSPALRWIASACLESFGVTSFWISWTPGVVSEDAWLKNTAETRSSRAPDLSSASIVFSKVGGSGFSAIASTSASCSAMPCSNSRRVVLLPDLLEGGSP